MKYILNFRGKSESQVRALLANAAFPVIMGGGQQNEGIKVFIEATQESFEEFIGETEDFEELFDITYVPEEIGSGSGTGSGDGSGSGSGSGSGDGSGDDSGTDTGSGSGSGFDDGEDHTGDTNGYITKSKKIGNPFFNVVTNSDSENAFYNSGSGYKYTAADENSPRYYVDKNGNELHYHEAGDPIPGAETHAATISYDNEYSDKYRYFAISDDGTNVSQYERNIIRIDKNENSYDISTNFIANVTSYGGSPINVLYIGSSNDPIDLSGRPVYSEIENLLTIDDLVNNENYWTFGISFADEINEDTFGYYDIMDAVSIDFTAEQDNSNNTLVIEYRDNGLNNYAHFTDSDRYFLLVNDTSLGMNDNPLALANTLDHKIVKINAGETSTSLPLSTFDSWYSRYQKVFEQNYRKTYIYYIGMLNNGATVVDDTYNASDYNYNDQIIRSSTSFEQKWK